MRQRNHTDSSLQEDNTEKETLDILKVHVEFWMNIKKNMKNKIPCLCY